MKRSTLVPRLHLFVCSNSRSPDSPLGPGCGPRGDRVFDALKGKVAERQAFRAIWVTKTHCLGLCPPRGAAVAVYPAQELLTEVEPEDADALVDLGPCALKREP